MTNIVFSARNEDNELKPMLVTATTTINDLRGCDVFTVFADSGKDAYTAASKAIKLVGFAGEPQLGSIIGRDGETRHLVRVWKSAPSSTDASDLLGI